MGEVTRDGTDRQERNKNPYRVHAGPPARAEKQADLVLRVLREAGNHGVNRDHFLSGTGPCAGRRCTQVGARLDELTKMGYIFESKLLPGQQFVTYFLRREPSQPLPPQKKGWKSQDFSYGRPDRRPGPPVEPMEQAALFAVDSSTSSDRFLNSELGKFNW